MDEDDIATDDECEYGPESARFNQWDVWVAFFGMLTGIFFAISGAFESLTRASVMAANKRMERDAFSESVGMEIERITSEPAE